MSRLLVVLPATAAFVVSLLLRPGDRGLAADAYFLFLGAVTLALLVRATAHSHPPARRSAIEQALEGEQAPRPERLAELERLEREVVLSRQSAFDAYFRLRPVLREISRQRLARRGVDLDAAGPAAERLLGPEAWAIVRPDLPRPRDHFAPGVRLEEMRRAIESLEALG